MNTDSLMDVWVKKMLCDKAQHKFIHGREACAIQRIGVIFWREQPKGNTKKVSKGGDHRDVVVTISGKNNKCRNKQKI